jgi:hypothetical protein
MPPADYDGAVFPRIYIKQIDADNDGIFAIVKVDGTDTEVQLYPHPEA